MALRLNKKQLSVVLAIDPKTLGKRLREAGAPKANKAGMFDVEDVRQFVGAASAAAQAGNTTVAGTKIHALREENLELEIAEKRREAAIKSGELIRKDQIIPAIEAVMLKLTANLQQKFERELPSKYRGRGMVECQQLNAAAVDWVLAQFKEGNDAVTQTAEKSARS